MSDSLDAHDDWETIAVPDTSTAVTVLPGGEVVTADEATTRARARLAKITTSFAEVLTVVADMYRDEDWRYLTRDDGTPYSNLAEVLMDALHVSSAMAYRHIQGARDFFLPLSAITVEGTVIPITSGDIKALGKSGLAGVVEELHGSLDGVDDPDDSEAIISAALAEARAKAEGNSRDDDWDPRNPDGAPAKGKKAKGESRRGEEGDGFDGDDWDDDDDSDFDRSGGSVDAGWGGPDDMGGLPRDRGPLAKDPDEAYVPAPPKATGDPIENILAGGASFHSNAECANLPDPLRDLVEAVNIIIEINASEASGQVTYETRGALNDMKKAISVITRFTTLTEVQPWVLERIE